MLKDCGELNGGPQNLCPPEPVDVTISGRRVFEDTIKLRQASLYKVGGGVGGERERENREMERHREGHVMTEAESGLPWSLWKKPILLMPWF